LTLSASWAFSNIIRANCARAYKLFDKQVDGKGAFLM
jgi:hypothetical protein